MRKTGVGSREPGPGTRVLVASESTQSVVVVVEREEEEFTKLPSEFPSVEISFDDGVAKHSLLLVLQVRQRKQGTQCEEIVPRSLRSTCT